jgi:hypothetical protein
VRNPKRGKRLHTPQLLTAASRLATLLFYMVSEPPATEVAAPATTRAVMGVLQQ